MRFSSHTPFTAAAAAALLIATAAAVPATAGPKAPESDAVQLITVEADGQGAKDFTARLVDFDVIASGSTSVTVLGDSRTAEKIRKTGLRVSGVQDYAESITGGTTAVKKGGPTTTPPSPLPTRLAGNTYPTFMGGYKTVAGYEAFGADIAAAYPELVQRVDFGDTWKKTNGQGGHDLIALRITAGANTDGGYPARPDTKARFVLSTQIHAREIITSEMNSRFVTELLNGYGTDARATALLDSTEVWVVFQSNPDGVDLVQQGLESARKNKSGDATPSSSSLAWQRKNLNSTGYVASSTSYGSSQPGVDLNRNWDVLFGGVGTSTNPANLTYHGVAAMSEPENAAKASLYLDLFGNNGVSAGDPAPANQQGTFLSLHSYSNLVIYPYGYTTTEAAPNAEALKNLGFRQSFENNYATGTAGEVIYLVAGAEDDWVYQESGAASYTWEIGTATTGGFFPGFSRTAGFWNDIRNGIWYAAQSAGSPYTTPAGPSVTALTATLSGASASVQATANDAAFGAGAGSAPTPASQFVSAGEVSFGTVAAAAGTGTAVTLADGVADATSENFTGSVAIPAGATMMFFRAKDATGNWGPARAATL